MPYTPIHKPFDLGAFDEELRGQTIDLLQNPTRGFRQSFIRADGNEFTADIAFICNVKAEDIEQAFEQYDDALFMWLFVPVLGDDEKWILPHVYKVWDAYAQERVKKLNAPQTRSATKGTDGQKSIPASESNS